VLISVTYFFVTFIFCLTRLELDVKYGERFVGSAQRSERQTERFAGVKIIRFKEDFKRYTLTLRLRRKGLHQLI
jgi:hypothetical protein